MTPETAPFPQRTIAHLLEYRARATPDRMLLATASRTYKAFELNQTVNRVAHGLLRTGIGPGTTVSVLSSNRDEMILVWLALAKVGAVSVPINVASKARQLAHVLSNSRSRFVVTETQWLPELLLIEHGLPDLERLIVLDAPEDQGPELGCDALAFTHLLAESVEDPKVPVHPTNLASIMYTGGTTGPSKGVMCCQSHFYWWGRILSANIGLAETDVWYTTLPLFHVNAQSTLLATVLTGAAMAVGDRFSASQYWAEARRHGATIGSLLGTMAHILYHREPPSKEGPPSSVRTIFCPALPAALHLDFEARFGVKVINAYGSTELNCVTMTPRGEPSRPGSMGRVLEPFELRVVDEYDAEVPVGTAGELVLRPREPFSIMTGYYEMPEKTVEAWRNLWFHTGDRGYRDADGHFYFVDRLKDSIRRRGENVSSVEVEQVVNGFDAVLESAAYPVPAEVGEDDVMVSVVPRPGRTVDVRALLQWCEGELPRFAVPRFVDIVRELPKTAVGRVEKFKLRDRGVTASTWDRERLGTLTAGDRELGRSGT